MRRPGSEEAMLAPCPDRPGSLERCPQDAYFYRAVSLAAVLRHDFANTPWMVGSGADQRTTGRSTRWKTVQVGRAGSGRVSATTIVSAGVIRARRVRPA